MKIAIDIDDCICNTLEYDFASGFVFNRNLKADDKTLYFADSFYVPDIFGWNKETAEDFFMKEKQYIIKANLMYPKPFAPEIIKKLLEEGNEIIILSSRESKFWNNDAYKYSKIWLEKFDIKYSHLVTDCENKGDYCYKNNINILIEDNVNYAKQVNDLNIQSILLVQNYNRNYENKLNHLASCWPEIYDKIKLIEKTNKIR